MCFGAVVAATGQPAAPVDSGGSTGRTDVVERLTTSLSVEALAERVEQIEVALARIDRERQHGIRITGFFDVQHIRSSGASNPSFGFGQCEVDLSAEFAGGLEFQVALALTDGYFGSGAAFLDYHFSGPEESHAPRGNFLSHSGMHLGQFDVPFGLDYRSIPAPDRPLLSTPAVVRHSTGSLNSIGLNVYGSSDQFNMTVFVVNGSDGALFGGGRAGLQVSEGLELGASTMCNAGAHGVSGSLIGIDLSASAGDLALQGEWITAAGILDGELTASRSEQHVGYYVQGRWDTNLLTAWPVFLVGRFSRWTPELGFDPAEGLIRLDELSLGAGLAASERLEVRMEWTLLEGAVRSTSTGLQAVMTF
jgi:hypothetical protein